MEEKLAPFSQIIHIQVLILIAKNLLTQAVRSHMYLEPILTLVQSH